MILSGRRRDIINYAMIKVGTRVLFNSPRRPVGGALCGALLYVKGRSIAALVGALASQLRLSARLRLSTPESFMSRCNALKQ
jgi:hypothetical protein